VILALTPPAWAQTSQAAKPTQGAAAKGTSPAFQQACIDLLNGRLPSGGAKAADALRDACNGLMQERTQAQREAEERAQAQKAAAAAKGAAPSGTGAGAPQPGAGQGSAAAQGTGVGAAFVQAGQELTGQKRGLPMGMRSSGRPVGYTLITNPVGWFTGLGINAEVFGAINPKFSWVGGARYSRTDSTSGAVDTFGLEGGADWFLIGQHNEGLRVGPRLELAFGRDPSQSSANFGWLGLSGEAGYNFIATNGITGTVAVGLGGRIAGHKREDFSSFTGGEFGAYAKLGIGYSW
jgi:hypothetical protein